MFTTPANVTHVTPLTTSLLRVTLTPKQYIDYAAGQYLQILSPTPGETLFYSIANAPIGSKTYELHIRHNPENIEHQHVLHAIIKEGTLTLKLPFGHCTLEALNLTKPIIFIAAGTGFAPIKAIIEQLMTNGHKEPLALYWSARSKEELYLDETVIAWEKHVKHFTYTPHVTQEHQSPFIERILTKHAKTLSKAQIVLAGPFDFIYHLRDILVEKGISKHQLFSDAFDLET